VYFGRGEICTRIGRGSYYRTCKWKGQSYFLIWAVVEESCASSDIMKDFFVPECVQQYEEVPIMRPGYGIGKPIF
jgi:hypothetical protein